jgi:hypothetical protein
MAFNIAHADFTGDWNSPTVNRMVPYIARIIRENAVDLALLNEAVFWRTPVPSGYYQVEHIARQAGMPYFQSADCNWLGLAGIKQTAVLSREPLGAQTSLETWVGLRNIGYTTLKTSVLWYGRVHHVYSVRFDASHVDENRRGFEVALQSLSRIPSSECIIFGGDLNASADPNNPNRDNYNLFRSNTDMTCGIDPNVIDQILFRGPYSFSGSVHSTYGYVPVGERAANNPDGFVSDHGYVLLDLTPDSNPLPWQSDWRWCVKCSGLFYAGGQSSVGRCPAGGQHVKTISGNYTLAHNQPETPSRQREWRWCAKCQGLFYCDAATSAGVCPAGGLHDRTVSGNYGLDHNQPERLTHQSDWRWCAHCAGLFYSGGQPSAGRCPASRTGGGHVTGVSGNYALRHDPV